MAPTFLGIFGGLLAAGLAQRYRMAPPPPQRVQWAPVPKQTLIGESDVHVRPGQETVLRYYYNCRGARMNLAASAQKGYVKQRPSTRYVCGNTDQPVVEFVYVGPQADAKDDLVTYVDQGRVSHIDHITLDGSVALNTPPAPIEIVSGEEKSIWRIWNCSGDVGQVATSVRSGFATVRNSVAAVCNDPSHPVKEVVYRSAQDFVGTDIVTLKQTAAAPIQLELAVSSAHPPAAIAESQPRPAEIVDDSPPDIVRKAVASSNDRAYDLVRNYFSAAYQADAERVEKAGANCALEHGSESVSGPFNLYQSATASKLESYTQSVPDASREATVKAVVDTAIDGGKHFKDEFVVSLVFESGAWKIDDVQTKLQASRKAIADIVANCKLN